MRILVAGGAGFIGSHLCEKLISQGHRVICIDSLVTGRIENLSLLFDSDRFEFYEQDIVNSFPFDLLSLDQVYNLACPASPQKYQHDPLKTIETNVIGMRNLLDIARENKARLLLASTSEVYGNPLEHPQREDYLGNVNTIGPRACYDEGKRCAETLAYEYNARMGVETRIARIFNTYGPKMQADDGRVVSNFLVHALTGKDITIHGDGQQTRCFCYIDDMVDGLIGLMNSNYSLPVNLGSTEEITINELADLVDRSIDKKTSRDYISLPVDDPVRRKPDITRASLILDWHPSTSIEIGLLQTAEYFKKELASTSKLIFAGAAAIDNIDIFVNLLHEKGVDFLLIENASMFDSIPAEHRHHVTQLESFQYNGEIFIPLNEYWVSVAKDCQIKNISEHALLASRSKSYLSTLLQNNNLSHVSRYSLDEPPELFPERFIARPDAGYSSYGVVSYKDLGKFDKDAIIKAVRSSTSSSMAEVLSDDRKQIVIEDYLEGDEYSVDVFFKQGEVKILRLFYKLISWINGKPVCDCYVSIPYAPT